MDGAVSSSPADLSWQVRWRLVPRKPETRQPKKMQSEGPPLPWRQWPSACTLLALTLQQAWPLIHSVSASLSITSLHGLSRERKHRAEITGGGRPQSKGREGLRQVVWLGAWRVSPGGRTERHCSLYSGGNACTPAAGAGGGSQARAPPWRGSYLPLSPPAGDRKPSVGGLPRICLPLPPLPEIYNLKGKSFIF